MKSLIHFLLISILPIIIIADPIPFPTTSEIEEIIAADQSNITGCPDTNLKLLKGGELYRSDSVLVWKGIYKDTIDVAIKIFNSENMWVNELAVFRRLNAARNSNIEKRRIPCAYYYGPVLNFSGIAMTLFDETLQDRFEHQKFNFSEPTILLIFKQTVEALQHIHSMYVMHNDIILRNIFICGQSVFIGDFDKSELNSVDMIFDYESLLRWIWDMVGVPFDGNVGLNEEDPVQLKYLKDRQVRKAFRTILKIEHIEGRYTVLPDYDVIIRTANAALTVISKDPVQFDWLKKSSSGASSSH